MEACDCCLLYWFYLITSSIAVLAVMVGCGSGAAVYIIKQVDDPQTKSEFSTIHTTSVLLIVIAVLVVLVVLCGFCGVCLNLSVMLVTFMIITVILIIAEIVAIGLTWKYTYKKELFKHAHDLTVGLLSTASKRYNTKAATICLTLLGFIQNKLSCCGADGLTDYDKYNLAPYKYLCQNANTGDYYKPGCSKTIVTWFHNNAGLVGIVAFGSIILQIVAIILAGLLLSRINNKSQDSDDEIN